MHNPFKAKRKNRILLSFAEQSVSFNGKYPTLSLSSSQERVDSFIVSIFLKMFLYEKNMHNPLNPKIKPHPFSNMMTIFLDLLPIMKNKYMFLCLGKR
jgi:hypothetical protein